VRKRFFVRAILRRAHAILARDVSEIPKLRRSRAAAPGTQGIWRRHGWRILALWALVAAAYSNSFQAELVFDSAEAILRDARIQAATEQNVRRILTQEYWYNSGASGLYRPLTTLSYLVNYAVLGNRERPDGYHWVNLALHATNVALVYALGIFVFSEPALAWALAALWGVHPLLTEAITNIVGRADLLAAFGVLAGLLCYVRGVRAPGWTRAAGLAGLVAAQTVGLFAKENAAVLPGLMLLVALARPRGAAGEDAAAAAANQSGKKHGRYNLFFFAALALPFGAFWYLRGGAHTHLQIPFFENPLVDAGFWTARLTAVKVTGKLVWLFLCPLRLSADYSYNAIPLASGRDAQTLIAMLGCLGGAILAVRWRKTRPALFLFTGFFFVAVAPTSNMLMLIGSIMAERFAYLPSIGLAGCAVAAASIIGARAPARAWWLVTALVCVAFAARTHARNLDWHDERSLWTSATDVCPDAARPHNNLGNALAQTPGHELEAMAEFRTALGIRPDYADAHYNLANALSHTPDRVPDALAEYEAALRLDPDYAQAHINLGALLAQIPKRLPEAITHFQAALRVQPDLADAHYDLANALARIPGRAPEAVAEYQATLRLQPGFALAHTNLGNILSQMPGRLPDAIAEYQAALGSQPQSAGAHNNLGNALAQMPGRLPDAIVEYQAALRSQPGFADAHYNLGIALARMPGRLPDAIAELEAALRISPDPQVRRVLEQLRLRLTGR
jgi:protein O-mannosyl-transferase